MQEDRLLGEVLAHPLLFILMYNMKATEKITANSAVFIPYPGKFPVDSGLDHAISFLMWRTCVNLKEDVCVNSPEYIP